MQRRIPTQRRSEETVECLYEAVARILEQGNGSRLTTNHIAERAGFSIGTLYGYFPDKSALLRGMAQQEAARQQESVQRALNDTAPPESPKSLVRHVIRAALRPFASRWKVRRDLMQLLLPDAVVLGAARVESHRVLMSLHSALAERWPDQAIKLSDNAQYTLTSAVMGAVHAVAIERPDYFETQEFEDEIVEIVVQRMMKPVTCPRQCPPV